MVGIAGAQVMESLAASGGHGGSQRVGPTGEG